LKRLTLIEFKKLKFYQESWDALEEAYREIESLQKEINKSRYGNADFILYTQSFRMVWEAIQSINLTIGLINQDLKKLKKQK
jgi:hypothetical protein